MTVIQALNSAVVRVAEFDDALAATSEGSYFGRYSFRKKPYLLTISVGTEESTFYAIRRLADLQVTCADLNKTLNVQKHAFSFRHLHRMSQTCIVGVYLNLAKQNT